MENKLFIQYQQLVNENQELKNELYSKISELVLSDKSLNHNFNLNGNFICTNCNSEHTCKAGLNKQGIQRYRCNECGRVRTATKDTLMFSSKKENSQWIKFIKSLLDGDCLSDSADKALISIRTAFRWRQKVMYVLNNLLNQEVLCNTVYLDETLFPVVFKNKNIPEIQEEIKRGISSQKINVTCAIDSNNNTIIKVVDKGRVTAKTLIKTYDGKIMKDSIVVSDSHRSYHQLMSHLEIEWKKIPSKKKSFEKYTLDPINRLHALIKDFTYKYKGISIKYLQGYLALFEYQRKHRKHYENNMFLKIISDIFTTPGHLRCKDIDSGKPIYQ